MAENMEKELPDLTDHKAAYQFLKTKGLLKLYSLCESCRCPLKIKESKKVLSFEAWVCDNEKCVMRSYEIDSLTGSFFILRRDKIDLSCQIHCIKYWCDRTSSVIAGKNLNLHLIKVDNFYEKCQVFITNYFELNPIELGGKDVTVVVKVLELFHRFTQKNSYLVMMVDNSQNPLIGYMQHFSSENLNSTNAFRNVLSVIENVVKPESVVVYDGAGSLPHIKGKKLTFINTCTTSQRNDLKSYFDFHIKTIRNIENTDPVRPELIINECMWRERFQKDAFKNFLEHLKNYCNQIKFYK